jgi:hypothetical protein
MSEFYGNYAEVISALRPQSPFIIDGNDYATLQWQDEDSTPPTLEEVEAKFAEMQAEKEATAYQRTRAEAYPSIGEQLDMIFHAGLGGDEFQAAIQAVKDAYPKP